MNLLLLDNGLKYVVLLGCNYNQKKYLYLINEQDSSDIRIVEIVDNTVIRKINDVNLLKNIISEMTSIVYKYFD